MTSVPAQPPAHAHVFGITSEPSLRCFSNDRPRMRPAKPPPPVPHQAGFSQVVLSFECAQEAHYFRESASPFAAVLLAGTGRTTSKRTQQLIRRERGRAQLAHDDAAGVVGHFRGIDQAQIGGKGEREQGDGCITRS